MDGRTFPQCWAVASSRSNSYDGHEPCLSYAAQNFVGMDSMPPGSEHTTQASPVGLLESTFLIRRNGGQRRTRRQWPIICSDDDYWAPNRFGFYRRRFEGRGQSSQYTIRAEEWVGRLMERRDKGAYFR
jgi:hypothetical protein